MNRIHEQLEQLRAQINLSKSELAEKCEKSRSAVVGALTGAKDTQLSVIEAIARSLGVEFVAVPKALAAEVVHFVAAGGRAFAQPAGIEAPKSAADLLKAAVKDEPRAKVQRPTAKTLPVIATGEMRWAPALTWPELETEPAPPAAEPVEGAPEHAPIANITLQDFAEDPELAAAAEKSREVARALDNGEELPSAGEELAQ